MIKSVVNCHIYELNGYLKCVSRMCMRRYSFGVSAYVANKEPDDFATELIGEWNVGDQFRKPDNFVYSGLQEIAPTDLFIEIENHVFNGLLALENKTHDMKRYLKEIIIEDINEYYGLASTSLNRNGLFHPLLSGKPYSLKIESKKHENPFCFLVKIEEVFVVSLFGKLRT